VKEFGRGYHRYKAGQYPVPDDEDEADRLDLQHHLWLKTLDGKLFLAPLDEKNLQNVLDIGTGTGIWAIDFADEHPSAEVIGIDLSPCQPTFVPPNCRFEIDDCEEPWTFKQKFDYIHGRVLVAAFKDWPKVFKQVYDGLRPGGWFEMHEILYPPTSDDGTLKEDSAFYQWGQLMVKGCKITGRELDVASKIKDWMVDAGFTEVSEIKTVWPQNPWPKDPKQKEIGRWAMATVLDGLQGFTMALMNKVLGMSIEEIELLLLDVRKEIRDKSIHSYWPIYIVYGRKPEQEA